jgi:DNA-binding transcriptional LysR family regulator
VADLAHHRLLGFTAPASLNTWPLAHADGEGWTVNPAVTASSGETVRHLALSGAGIACLSDFLTRADLAAGRLVPVLEAETLPWTQPVWAVFYKQGGLAPRVAALVEFLARRLADVLER